MATRAQLFPSPWLKAEDLKEKEVTLNIDSTSVEEVGMDKDHKCVISFKGTEKRLVLNATNYDSIAALHGEETDNWSGKCVTVFATTTDFGSKRNIPCIRVRDYEKPATEKGDLEAELSDSIPF